MSRPEADTLTLAELREIAALDAALEGRAVDEDLASWADVALALRAEAGRPEPDAARRLDERLRPRLQRPARRWMPVAGLAATMATALVVAVAVVATNGSDPGGSGSGPSSGKALAPEAAPAAGSAGAADSAGAAADKAPAAPGDTVTAQSLRSALAPLQRYAAPGGTRHVQRAARLELGTKRDQVDDVADDAIRIADRAGGFVLSSSVQTGDGAGEGGAGAQLDLRVPARRLDRVMADLSALGHVRLRADDTQDITAQFRSARERLREARAEREALLRSLARADTLNETRSIRARLRIVSGQIRAARADVTRVRRAEALSPVSMTIVADASAEDDDAGWTAGDAWHDAGRVLEVALGVVLVAGAALLPIALAALAAALAAGAVRRRRRERALDAS
jgi:Domain of unknown function (DUF4349)